jgi:hypothetical protein
MLPIKVAYIQELRDAEPVLGGGERDAQVLVPGGLMETKIRKKTTPPPHHTERRATYRVQHLVFDQGGVVAVQQSVEGQSIGKATESSLMISETCIHHTPQEMTHLSVKFWMMTPS